MFPEEYNEREPAPVARQKVEDVAQIEEVQAPAPASPRPALPRSTPPRPAPHHPAPFSPCSISLAQSGPAPPRRTHPASQRCAVRTQPKPSRARGGVPAPTMAPRPSGGMTTPSFVHHRCQKRARLASALRVLRTGAFRAAAARLIGGCCRASVHARPASPAAAASWSQCPAAASTSSKGGCQVM